MTQEAAAPTLREAFIAAFMDGLSWMLANPESKPGEWRQAAVDCAGMRLATRPADPAEPTDAQIAAYLKANNTYWHETDQELPNKPGQWRNGNVKEATRVSLRAALATPAEPMDQWRLTSDRPSGNTPGLTRWGDYGGAVPLGLNRATPAKPHPLYYVQRFTIGGDRHAVCEVATGRVVLRNLDAALATPAEPTLREAELIDELRAVARAYPEDVFLPLDDEDKKHPLTIQRASAAMGRHMAPLLLRAADALAARPADPVEPPTLPSSRERWNAENPGELSLHTFDDDDTPAEPSVRAALEALLEHCGKQGWWLQSHAIKVMDDANVALSARATLTTIPSATEPAHLAVKLAAFREAIRGHIGGEEYALISEVVRAIASRATEPDRNAALTDEQIDTAEKAYAAQAVPAWTSNRHRPALAAAIRAAIATRTTTKD